MAGATQLVIYNRALALIGARAALAVATDTSSLEGRVLNQHWPNVLNEALEGHDWSFARSKLTLTPATMVQGSIPGFPYNYQTPSNCLVFRGVFNGFAWGTYPIVPFSRETMDPAGGGTDLVGTVVSQAVGVFTRTLTDPSTTTYLFTSALSVLLASYVAFEITESAQLGPALAQAASNQIENAWREDMQQLRAVVRTQFVPDWQAARG